ncbi:MAG: hypothetical protein IJH12_08570 [Clostridia bacterium]|nr:hypothetical protein [Clostridia bacterium]
MENNEKISFIDKVRNYFSSLFKRNKPINELLPEKNSNDQKEYKQRLQHEVYINELAEKLLYGEIGPTDVEDEYLDEIMNYFKNDIQTTKNKIEQCKQRIQKMQAEMN